MTDRAVTKISKWPFLLGDLILLGFAAWFAVRPQGPWTMVLCLVAVALGAWLCALPFLRDHAAELRFAEADALATAAAKIEDLEAIKSRMAEATTHWRTMQEQAAATLAGGREISERMAAQTEEFRSFFQRANDQEKSTLRLELEKMKRGEADWIQVVVRMLDYTQALHSAGVRSGQPALIDELTQFQNACRDTARRVGLLSFAPAPNEPFDARLHQTRDTQNKADGPARIAEVLATGFTFQAQLLRRALVRVESPIVEAPAIQEGSCGQLEPAKQPESARAEPLRDPGPDGLAAF